ncbi:hypothetical protein [Agrococcus jejuensis]|uniref:Uncharacterized protein n=1 Tax=Agrococcus jejuensis TaxID=399736 RepID=A0A1G8B682_9MICO|nr:hypothetical protein [Agrococcus jejuensis]SDH28513.1 hypothetical protein SAMN04489720_0680 [Agrococcus jejuensis]
MERTTRSTTGETRDEVMRRVRREQRSLVLSIAAVALVQLLVLVLIAVRSDVLTGGRTMLIPVQHGISAAIAIWMALVVAMTAYLCINHQRDERRWPGAVHVRETWRIQRAHAPGVTGWIGAAALLPLAIWLPPVLDMPWVGVVHTAAMWIGPAITAIFIPLAVRAQGRIDRAGALTYTDVVGERDALDRAAEADASDAGASTR